MAAGPRSLLAFWLGGAAAPAASAGVRGLLAPWIGGAAAPATTQGAVRGLLAFWSGGAAAGAEVEPQPAESSPGGVRRVRVPRALVDAQRLQAIDEDDTMLLIACALAAHSGRLQ